MKKILFWGIVIYLCYMFYGYYQDYQADKIADDYLLLQQLESECEYIIDSKFMKNLNPDSAMHEADLSNIHNSQHEVWLKMQEDLGEDFPIRLSNMDHVYVTLIPAQYYYAIYVGNDTEKFMVYPDWEYTKMAKPEGFAAN